MEDKTLKVTINGTGFAADYSAQCYGMIPHKNGVGIELAGVTSGRIANAETFAEKHGVGQAFANHAEMLEGSSGRTSTTSPAPTSRTAPTPSKPPRPACR